MNPAVATVVVAVIAGSSAILGALVNAVIGRGGRRADIAEKVTEVWDKTSARLDKDLARLEEKCGKCESRLSVTERRLADTEGDARKAKAALRALIRVLDTEDPEAIREAIAAARALL